MNTMTEIEMKTVCGFSFYDEWFEFDLPAQGGHSFVIEETRKNGQEDCHFAIEVFKKDGELVSEYTHDDKDPPYYWDFNKNDLKKMLKGLEHPWLLEFLEECDW